MKNLKNIFSYLLPSILSLAILAVFLQLWKIDLRQPIFSYSGDEMLGSFIIKNIINGGWWYSSEFVGLPHFGEKFLMHDFPIHADFFNFFIIKIFTYFSSNPFLILNSFFIFTFALISSTSFICLKSFKISNFTATLISVLYAFTFYHFARNSGHAFLANYSPIPLVVMVALWIVLDEIKVVGLNNKHQFCFTPNKQFFAGLAVSGFVAMNGAYYSAYSCLIFVFAWLLNCLKTGSFLNQKFVTIFFFIALIALVQTIIYLPAFIYFSSNGFIIKLDGRNPFESMKFALKIVALLLPNHIHRIDSWLEFTKKFSDFTTNEATSESLGIIGSAAFLFLLFWLFAKNQDGVKSFLQKIIHKFSLDEKNQNLISALAGLNLLVILYSTMAGFVIFIAVFFPTLRSHNRFSIFIAFFALFLAAIILDKILQNKKIWTKFLALIIFILALLDQTPRLSSLKSKDLGLRFNSDKNFIEKIERKLPQSSKIFTLPFTRFPEALGNYANLIGYLHSKNLRWSYPAMRGGESDLWQEKISKLDLRNFIFELKKAGFVGVFINREIYEDISGQKLEKIESILKKSSVQKYLISEDRRMEFFEI